MKPLALLTASLLSLLFGATVHAAIEAPAETPPHAVKAAKAPVADEAAKPMLMHTKVDTIDATDKSFTHTTEKGTKLIHILTATSVVMQGDKAAQFSDIKVGDYVSGTHLKKSDTEYEIVKITKFGPKAEKADKKVSKKSDKKADNKAPVKTP